MTTRWMHTSRGAQHHLSRLQLLLLLVDLRHSSSGDLDAGSKHSFGRVRLGCLERGWMGVTKMTMA